jgi:hypothetical protein
VSSIAWSYEDVALWLGELKLEEGKNKLQDAGVDARHLFMLADSDLEALGITSKIMQLRIMQEISQLKLRKAKGID